MTDKQKLRVANMTLSMLNEKSRNQVITIESNEIYLSKLEKIYRIESETIFKKSEKMERFVRK